VADRPNAQLSALSDLRLEGGETRNILVGEFSVAVRSISLLAKHHNAVFIAANLKNIKLEVKQLPYYQLITISAENLSLHNSQKSKGLHEDLIRSHWQQNALSIDVKIYKEENLIKINQYSTYVGVRLSSAILVFLKRDVFEIVDYIKDCVM